jgi:hypothetical protein
MKSDVATPKKKHIGEKNGKGKKNITSKEKEKKMK